MSDNKKKRTDKGFVPQKPPKAPKDPIEPAKGSALQKLLKNPIEFVPQKSPKDPIEFIKGSVIQKLPKDLIKPVKGSVLQELPKYSLEPKVNEGYSPHTSPEPPTIKHKMPRPKRKK